MAYCPELRAFQTYWLDLHTCKSHGYGFQSLIGPVLDYLSQVIDYPGVYNPKISALLWGAV